MENNSAQGKMEIEKQKLDTVESELIKLISETGNDALMSKFIEWQNARTACNEAYLKQAESLFNSRENKQHEKLTVGDFASAYNDCWKDIDPDQPQLGCEPDLMKFAKDCETMLNECYFINLPLNETRIDRQQTTDELREAELDEIAKEYAFSVDAENVAELNLIQGFKAGYDFAKSQQTK